MGKDSAIGISVPEGALGLGIVEVLGKSSVRSISRRAMFVRSI